MFRIFILILFYLFSNGNFSNALAEKNEIKDRSISNRKLNWEYGDLNLEDQLYWHESTEKDIYNQLIKINNKTKKNIYSVRSTGKGVTVNGSISLT